MEKGRAGSAVAQRILVAMQHNEASLSRKPSRYIYRYLLRNYVASPLAIM
jgi:hypothetical protein